MKQLFFKNDVFSNLSFVIPFKVRDILTWFCSDTTEKLVTLWILLHFSEKVANVAKIHFHSFWRAAAPRKAGKPIRLFSLMENTACGLWSVRQSLLTCEKNPSTNQNLCCLSFVLFIICAVYQHVHNNQIQIRHYSYCSCNLVSAEGTK